MLSGASSHDSCVTQTAEGGDPMPPYTGGAVRPAAAGTRQKCRLSLRTPFPMGIQGHRSF